MMPNPFSPDAPSDLAEHCTCIKQRSQEEIIFFARLAFSLPNEGWLTKECKDLAAFYDYIQEFPASDAERFRILGIVRNFSKYADELAEMLKPVITALVNGAPVYTPLLERFAEVYRDKQPEAVFGTEEAAPVYDTSAQVLELYPRLFIIDEYYTLTYQQSRDTPLCNHLEIGVLYDVAKLYQKRDIPLREIAGCVKVIGDPVRLQILTMLKDEEVYVQELTDKLGLSFTTLIPPYDKVGDGGACHVGTARRLCVLQGQFGLHSLAYGAGQRIAPGLTAAGIYRGCLKTCFEDTPTIFQALVLFIKNWKALRAKPAAPSRRKEQ